VNAPLVIEGLLSTPHGAAVDAARWRGQCVDYYAQIEFLVGTTLRELSEKDETAPQFTYRTKIAALRDAVKGKHPNLFRTLEKLHCSCDRRNLIVHASGAVTQTPAGHWMWTGCYLLSDRQADMVAEAIARPEAEKLEIELKGTVQSLKSHLASLKKRAVTK
jgi:hypothetical protein